MLYSIRFFLTIFFTIIILLFVYHCLSNLSNRKPYLEGSNRRRYYHFYNNTNNEDFKIPALFVTVLEKQEYTHTSNISDAQIIFFKTLDNFDKETLTGLLCAQNAHQKPKWLYGLKDVNLLASKSTLALILSRFLPSAIPETWVLSNKSHQSDLLQEFTSDGNPKRLLLLKNNRQQQKGLFFVNHINDIERRRDTDNCVVCQAVLSNPYLFNEVKVNFRLYLLIVHTKKRMEYQLYDDGFVYYAQAPFNDKSKSFTERHITTGLQGRDVYRKNPLTFKEFCAKLSRKEYTQLKNNIFTLFSNVLQTFDPFISTSENTCLSSFVLLGCDVAPDKYLNVKLMEINKGPDLSPKDQRDKELKLEMISETLSFIERFSIYDNVQSSRFLDLKKTYKNNFI